MLVKKLAHTHRFEHEPSGLKSKHLTPRPRTPELCELWAETSCRAEKHPHFTITLAYRKCNKPGTAQVGAISKAQKDSKTTFSTTGDNKSSQKLKIEKKIPNFFFEVSDKSHSAEKCKRGDAFYLMLDALDALKMKY